MNPPEEKLNNPYWDYIKMNLINVDFAQLKAQNNDTAGWIQVNGTNINYPFVQTTDNSYYLKKFSIRNIIQQAGYLWTIVIIYKTLTKIL